MAKQADRAFAVGRYSRRFRNRRITHHEHLPGVVLRRDDDIGRVTERFQIRVRRNADRRFDRSLFRTFRVANEPLIRNHCFSRVAPKIELGCRRIRFHERPVNSDPNAGKKNLCHCFNSLKTELGLGRKYTELIDQIGRQKHVDAVDVIGIALNDELVLELFRILDKPGIHPILVQGHKFGLD